MKIPKLFHFVVLLVVAVAPLFFPTQSEAAGDNPSIAINDTTSVNIYSGKYQFIEVTIARCDEIPHPPVVLYLDSGYQTQLVAAAASPKQFTAEFSDPVDGDGSSETITVCTGNCGCSGRSSKKVSTCGGFYIPKRVPQSSAIPVSFKGPGNITSADITFKDLGYSLSLWLHRYDWGGGTWYGYLNTTYLPLGKHHGRVTTFVDGVRGGGCATGGFKVVDE